MEKRVTAPAHVDTTPAYITLIQDREMARSIHAPKPKELHIYTDGSGIKGRIGPAATMRDKTGRWISLRYGLGTTAQHTVYEAELTGIILALHMANGIKNWRRLSIFTDNQAAILSMKGKMTGA